MTSEKLETSTTTKNTGLKSEKKELKNLYSFDSTMSKNILSIKFCNFFASLNIELVLFLFMFSFILNTTCLTNMMMDKGCINYFRYSKNVCHHIFEHREERNNVEILANNYNLYLDCLELIAAFIVIFIAPWSDKYSRKTPLIVALFGFFLSDIGIMLCTFYFSSSLDYIILSHLPTQLLGGFICVMTMINSYSSEISSKEFRSMKYYYLQISFGIAVTLGALTGGQIYHFYGYLTVYAVGAFGHLLAIFWVIAFVPETQGLAKKVSWRAKFEDFYSPKNFIEGFKTCIRRRNNGERTQLWFLLLSSCCISIMYKVYTDTSYVYAHHMYGWDPTLYSQMWTIFSFTELIIFLVLTTVFIRVLKLNDFLIGIIGIISIILKTVLLSFAIELWVYYMSNILGSLNGLGNQAIKTLISKRIPEDELGKVFAFQAAFESIIPLLCGSVILKIFNATIKIFPGTFYLVATAFLLLPLATFIWLRLRNQAKESLDTSNDAL